jgi:hypothetical protein
LGLQAIKIFDDTRRGKEKREKRKEREPYAMRDDPTSGALCFASLKLRQAGTCERIKAALKGVN